MRADPDGVQTAAVHIAEIVPALLNRAADARISVLVRHLNDLLSEQECQQRSCGYIIRRFPQNMQPFFRRAHPANRAKGRAPPRPVH